MERPVDKFATSKGSTAQILKAQREAKRKRLKELEKEMNMSQYLRSK